MSIPTTIDYVGSFERTLDDKGRLTLPSAWRSEHDEATRFMAVVIHGYVAVLTPDEVTRVRGRIREISFADKAKQAAVNEFFSKAQVFSFDKAGRVLLDPAIREKAGIKDQSTVHLVGALTKFSIFSPEALKRNQALAADLTAQIPETAEDKILQLLGI